MASSLHLRYQRFIEANPVRKQELESGEGRLEYLDCGSGEPLLLLPGLFSRADSWFPLVERLANRFRCVPVTYFSCSQIDHLSVAILALMDQLGLERANLLGHSFGGMLAQHLTRYHPYRFTSLILAHSGTVPLHLRRRVLLLKGLLSVLPEVLARRVWSRWFAGDRGDPGADRFWAEYRTQRQREVDHREVANHAGLFLDLCLDSSSERHWTGPVLIIDSDNDTTFSMAHRARLRRRFPQGDCAIFVGSGHASLIRDPEGYGREVSRFLKRAPGAAPLQTKAAISD